MVVFGSGGGIWWDLLVGGKQVGELYCSFYIAQVSLQLI